MPLAVADPAGDGLHGRVQHDLWLVRHEPRQRVVRPRGLPRCRRERPRVRCDAVHSATHSCSMAAMLTTVCLDTWLQVHDVPPGDERHDGCRGADGSARVVAHLAQCMMCAGVRATGLQQPPCLCAAAAAATLRAGAFIRLLLSICGRSKSTRIARVSQHRVGQTARTACACARLK